MPRRRTPWIWLNEGEKEGTATCGCRLVRDYGGGSSQGGPALFECALHGTRIRKGTWENLLMCANDMLAIVEGGGHPTEAEVRRFAHAIEKVEG